MAGGGRGEFRIIETMWGVLLPIFVLKTCDNKIKTVIISSLYLGFKSCHPDKILLTQVKGIFCCAKPWCNTGF